jgi:hypothetical protein
MPPLTLRWRLAAEVGIANMDSQFGYGQLTLAFPFLTMLFAISQDGYTHPGRHP